MCMEQILEEYFGCKRPFKKNETLSKNGERAYARLISLLEDINLLAKRDYNLNGDVFDLLKDIDDLVGLKDMGHLSLPDRLDEIAPSDEKNMSKFVVNNEVVNAFRGHDNITMGYYRNID